MATVEGSFNVDAILHAVRGGWDDAVTRGGKPSLWFRLNESSSPLADSANPSYPATVNGTPTYDVEGVVGKAITWAGGATPYQYAATSSYALAVGNTFTMAAWVKPTSAVRQTILGCNDAGYVFQLEIAANNAVSAIRTGEYIATSTANDVTTNQWNYIVYTRSGTGAGTHKIYVNGTERTLTVSVATDFQDNSSVKLIGARQANSQRFYGTIDEVLVWPRAISQTEVTAQSSAGYLNFPVAAWQHKLWEKGFPVNAILASGAGVTMVVADIFGSLEPSSAQATMVVADIFGSLEPSSAQVTMVVADVFRGARGFLVDASILFQGIGSPLLDATLHKFIPGSFPVEAEKDLEWHPFTLRALIVGTLTPGSWSATWYNTVAAKDFSVEAWLAGAINVDAWIRLTAISGDFTADATLLRSGETWETGFTTDAWFVGGILVDAYIRLVLRYGDFEIDARILELPTTKYPSGFVPRAFIRTATRFGGGFEVDAATVLKTTEVFLVLAYLGHRITLDAYIARHFRVSAVVRGSVAGTFTADALIRTTGWVFSRPKVDAVLKRNRSGGVTLDAFIQEDFATGTGSFTASALVNAPVPWTFALDAELLESVKTWSFPASADIARVGEKRSVLSVQSVIRSVKTDLFLVEARIGTFRTGSFTAAALVKDVEVKTFTLDAVLRTFFQSNYPYYDKALAYGPKWYMPFQEAQYAYASWTPYIYGEVAGGDFTIVPSAGSYIYNDNSTSTYAYVATNTTGTYSSDWYVATPYTGFIAAETIYINIRYAWGSTPSNTTWPALRAQFFKADGTTPLTDEMTVATNITTTTATWSGAVQMTGVDKTATRTDWTGSLLRITVTRTKSGSGSSAQQRVYDITWSGTTYKLLTTTADNVMSTTNGSFDASITPGSVGPSTIAGATSFYHASDWVDLNNAQMFGSAARTLTLWYRNTQTAQVGLYEEGNHSTRQNFAVAFNRGATGRLYLVSWDDDPYLYVGERLYDNQWHFLAIAYDGDVTAKAYLDGEFLGDLVFAVALNTTSTTGDDVLVGHWHYYNWTGYLTHVAMYPVALTAAQIAHLATGDNQYGLKMDAVICSPSGAFPGHLGSFAVAAIKAQASGTKSFTVDATKDLPWHPFNVNAVIQRTTTSPRTLWLAAVIGQPSASQAFTVDAFIEGAILISAWIATVAGDLYGGVIPVEAYIWANDFIVWPEDGGPAEFPNGEPVPDWFKANRKFRVNIIVGGTDVTADVIWQQTMFTQNAKTNPGTFEIVLEGATSVFDGGEKVFVTLDDLRVFGGIVLSVERSYAFDAAGPSLTVIRGADFNVLFDKYIVYNRNWADEAKGSYKTWKAFAKNTQDTTIIHKVFDSYVDVSIDHRTYVDEVGIANPEKPWVLPTPGSSLRATMQSIGQVTNAVWWIDAYEKLHYHSRSTVTAPYPITDGKGGIAAQVISLARDMSKLVTHDMLWGTLAKTTKGEIMVAEEESEYLPTYGIWQWGELRPDIHHQSYINRRARSIIERYGQPIESAKAVIFEPGYQAGQVVAVNLSEHGVNADLVIREMKLTFAVAKEPDGDRYYAVPRFELAIGLDPEEPWNIYDYLPFPGSRTPWLPRGQRWCPGCGDPEDECTENIRVGETGFVLDLFDRDIPDQMDPWLDNTHNDPSVVGPVWDPSWGFGDRVNWSAFTFLRNKHHSVRDGRGVIHAMNAHYTLVSEEHDFAQHEFKGQTTVIGDYDLMTMSPISVEHMLWSFRIHKTRRAVTPADVTQNVWGRGGLPDISQTFDTTIYWNPNEPLPNLDTGTTAGAGVIGHAAGIEITVNPPALYPGEQITGLVLKGSDPYGSPGEGAWPDGPWHDSDGAGLVGWIDRYAGGTKWKKLPGGGSHTYTQWRDDSTGGLHYIPAVGISALFFEATDMRPDDAWPNRVFAEFAGSGSSKVAFDRSTGGNGEVPGSGVGWPFLFSVTAENTALTGGSQGEIGMPMIWAYLQTETDYYVRLWRPNKRLALSKIWPVGTPEPEAYQIYSCRHAGAMVAGDPMSPAYKEEPGHDFEVWAAYWSMQSYDLEFDTLIAGAEEGDIQVCDDGTTPYDEEGEMFGVISEGWNIEVCTVYEGGMFVTSAQVSRGTLTVYDDEGIWISPNWTPDAPSWSPIDGGPFVHDAQHFQVHNTSTTRVTAAYRAAVANIGEDHSVPRTPYPFPNVRTIPPTG